MYRILRNTGTALKMRLEAIRPRWLEKQQVRWLRRDQRVSSDYALMRRLFIDVSIIAVSDAGTGIQRVVRGILRHVPEAAGEKWSVQLVRADHRQPYALLNPPSDEPSEMQARPGDVFLGLDYSLDAVANHHRQLARFKRDGGTLWFLLHDLLPLHRPDWFSRHTTLRYRRWLRNLAILADGFFCNSDQTEAELHEALTERYGLRDGFRTFVLPMGADLPAGVQLRKSSREDIPRSLTQSRYVLMVGTLEPRKGHDDVLSAFERLWPNEAPALVIVGRRGWKRARLEARLRAHPLLGSKLFWLNDVGDEELKFLYTHCEGVIVAAHAEGYGLPVVEALGYGKPVLARDIPIFRQHESSGARFFPANATFDELAVAIGKWVAAVGSGLIEVRPPSNTWRGTTVALLEALDATSSFRPPCSAHDQDG